MEKHLIIYGVWLLFLPLMKWNVVSAEKDNKNKLLSGLCYASGVYSILIGLNAIVQVVDRSTELVLVLYAVLLLLSMIYIYKKIRLEHSAISRMAVVISALLVILSVCLVVSAPEEAASASVMLIGTLMVLAAPYDAIKGK